MTKLYIHTEEIEHCGECAEALGWLDTGKSGHRCDKGKRRRIIRELWGKIPKWCLLPDWVSDEVILIARDYLDSAEVPTDNRMMK